MTADAYVTVSAQIPMKTRAIIDKMAAEYGLSRANMIMKILESVALDHGEAIEVSTVTPDGVRNRETNIPINIRISHRKLL